MVDFRKSFLLVAAVLLVSSVASSQVIPAFSCTATAGVPPIVRAEGLAEFVGDVVLDCTGGTPTLIGQPVPLVNFRVFLNTTVTSARNSSSSTWTESILEIDDPAPDKIQALRGPHTTANTGEDLLSGVGAEPGINYANPTAASNLLGAGGVNVDSRVYNVFQGELVAQNQLEWRGVPIDPPGTNHRIIRITNVRANANQFGVSGTFIPAQLTMFISATASFSVPINQPTQVVAVVQDGMTFDVVKPQGYLQCNSEAKASKNDYCAYDLLLRYRENFPTAFKEVGPSPDSDHFGIGIDVNTESNYYNPRSGSYQINTVFGLPSGLSTQGTRLMAKFDTPSGVSLQVYRNTKFVSCSTSSSDPEGTIPAQLIDGEDSNGAGGSWDSGDVWEDLGASRKQVVWEVYDFSDDRSLFLDTAIFGVDVYYTSNTTTGIPALGTGTVSGSYAPLSTRNLSEARGSTSHPVPRFFNDAEAMDMFNINSCSTSLLWPYVVNQAGFDTGMVISNTSKDPWGDNEQKGACRIYYYGSGPGGGSPPAPVDTPVVEAGEYAIWLLSAGGEVRPAGVGTDPGGSFAGAPGFEGYVIAICQFQYAHGYAFITRNGATDLAQGYIPLILDEPADNLPRSGSQSEPLNQ